MSALSRYDYKYTSGGVIKSKSHFLMILWCSEKEFGTYKCQDGPDNIWRRNFKHTMRDVVTIFAEYGYDELMERIAARVCARCDIKDIRTIDIFVEVSASMIAGGRHYIRIHRDNAAEMMPLMLMDDGDIRVYVRELSKQEQVEIMGPMDPEQDWQSDGEKNAVSAKDEKRSLWSNCDDQSLAPSEVTAVCEKSPSIKRPHGGKKKKGNCSPQ